MLCTSLSLNNASANVRLDVTVYWPQHVLIGPPGAGKTLLARAMPGRMPGMSIEEALDVTRIYSATDQLPPPTWRNQSIIARRR
jgi:predicted ATPase